MVADVAFGGTLWQGEIATGDGESPDPLATDLRLGPEGPRAATARRRLRTSEQVLCTAPKNTSASARCWLIVHLLLPYARAASSPL
jgi:hypothetical protein